MTEHSFSSNDIASRCALPASAGVIPGFAAAFTLSVTSSMPCNTTNSTLNVNNVTFSATNLALSVTNWTNVQDYFYSQNFTGATPNGRGQTPENQITFSGFTAANTSWLSNDHQITPAPEPATYGMIFVGLSVAAVGLRRLLRRRQPAKAA